MRVEGGHDAGTAVGRVQVPEVLALQGVAPPAERHRLEPRERYVTDEGGAALRRRFLGGGEEGGGGYKWLVEGVGRLMRSTAVQANVSVSAFVAHIKIRVPLPDT